MVDAAADSAIPIRRPAFELTAEIPRYWKGGSAFATHLLDALSSTFPDGEAFFVKSVQRYRGEITDPKLLAEIHGFAGQEAQHGRQHRAHLALLEGHGYTAIAHRNRVARWIFNLLLRRAPRAALAATAALEHLTSILARRVLADDARFCADMDPRMAALWTWHALEESEHKAVAFDVLQQVAPGHTRRVIALVGESLGLALETTVRTLYMLYCDGLLFRRDTWRDALPFLFGRDGLLRGTGPEYRAWYRRDFHPDEVDDEALLALWRERIAS